MTTYILIPRRDSRIAGAMTGFARVGEPPRPDVNRRALRQMLQVLPSGRFATGPLATSDGLEPAPDQPVTRDPAQPDAASVRQDLVPRALEALGILLVEDLDGADIDALSGDGVDVIANYAIDLPSPVFEGQEVTTLVTDPWHLDRINVAAARSQGLSGAGQRIGVLDTGIDASHPEFAGKSIAFMEFDEQGFRVSSAPRDAGSHGTHVSGIAAGSTAGVANGADLAVAAVLTTATQAGLSGTLAQILAGTNWLIQSDFGAGGPADAVDVMNASLGGRGYDPFLYDLLAQARLVPGVQLVAAIGNDGPASNSHGSPGNYDIVVGVGATDRDDRIARFSSWGTVAAHDNLAKPDLSAPGVDVESAIPGGGYAVKSGTSMASPVVAGAAALFLEKDAALAQNPGGLVDLLLESSLALEPVAQVGRGRLDLTGI